MLQKIWKMELLPVVSFIMGMVGINGRIIIYFTFTLLRNDRIQSKYGLKHSRSFFTCKLFVSVKR